MWWLFVVWKMRSSKRGKDSNVIINRPTRPELKWKEVDVTKNRLVAENIGAKLPTRKTSKNYKIFEH